MSEMENSSSPKLTASTASPEASTVSSSGNQMALDEPMTDSSLPPPPPPPPFKKKRNQPGMPDPDAEVIALSPKALLATNRFVCEICGKGFQRDQNLQLHRRGHNLPWKLRQRGTKEPRKRVYVCPEPSCVHHDPRRALGDLTGIKKHFCRKHGEKKWKCERCAKKYAVQSDWKAHMKICGTKEYKCDCGTVFSRRDSFVTHRAFCDALTQESVKVKSSAGVVGQSNGGGGGGEQRDVNSGGTSDAAAAASAGSLAEVTTTTASRSVSPVLQNQSSDLPEITAATLPSCTAITSATNMATADNNSNVVFGSIFTQMSLLQHQHQQAQEEEEEASQQVPSMPNMRAPFSTSNSDSTQSSQPLPPPHSFTHSCPIDQQPTSLSLSSSPYHQYSPFFLTQQQQHLHPPASMSATALLQKAAQMGAATASATSLLSGYGLSTSGTQHGSVSQINNITREVARDENSGAPLFWPPSGNGLQAAIGGVPSDSTVLNGGMLFGSRPTTLDLLGLGIGGPTSGVGGGSTPAGGGGGLSALLNSFASTNNGELNFTSYESSTWEENERKPNQTVQ